ncbi:BTAD domain-containing putative transcriptional regulator [Arthrobacter sp. C152]
MGALWIRALGPLEVTANGTQIALGARQQRKVLACLALRANSVVSPDTLIESIWPGNTPSKPGPQLQVYVANLRRVLDPGRPKGEPSQRLASRSTGYVLAVSDEELDLLRFRAQRAAGEIAVEDGDLQRGAECLRDAVGLFRGPAFPDLADVALFRPELEALEETRLNVYQDLFDVELALGRHELIVSEVQALLAQQKYRERLWACLILSLYRSDRQADALTACREARRVFTRELGIDPGPLLRELETSVLKQDASLAAPSDNGHHAVHSRLDNLPAEITDFIGREAELGELCGFCSSRGSRLVTVTGPGGTGKTRLALAAARKLLPREADGACWVDLAPLTQPHQVPTALAKSLGLEEPGGAAEPLEVVTRFLRQRHLLLVLDNFEHLEDAWPTVAELLTAAPDVRILVTSRSPIGLRAEQEYQLPPLALPPADFLLPPESLQEVPSVKLFLARARAARADITLTDRNAGTIARICQRLDGLPLAIELAAAQLRQSGEDQLLADLEVSLAAIPAAFRDLPDRQKTLTATIAWSHQLLGEEERDLFVQLGVFVGDPAVAAVSGVYASPSSRNHGTAERLLAALARHSMLRLYADPVGSMRVSMLQPIKEFARNALALRDDAAVVRRRHAEYYLRLAEEVGPDLWGNQQAAAFRLLHADAPDLREALLWSAGPEGSVELALKLVGQLWHYWELTEMLAEPCQIAEQLLAIAEDVPPAVTAPALSGTATLCWRLGRNGRATQLHQRAFHAFNAAGNQQGAAWAMMCLAVQAAETGDVETAKELAAEAAAQPQAGSRTQFGAHVILERLAFYSGDYSRAHELARVSVRLARRLGDPWTLVIALVNQADGAQQAGDYEAAESLLLEALRSALELGAQGNLEGLLESLAGVYIEQGQAELAVRLLAACATYRVDRGHPLNASEHERVEAMTAKARKNVGPISFALSWARGKALTLRQAVHEALPDADTASLPEAGSPQLLPPGAEVSKRTDAASAAPW